MPEILRLFGLIFSIYTRDHQPPHVHVRGTTIELEKNCGMKNKDIRLAEAILEENKDLVISNWVKIHGRIDD